LVHTVNTKEEQTLK